MRRKAAITSPHVSSAVAYEGRPGPVDDDMMTPRFVAASTSTWGKTPTWQMMRSRSSRSSSGAVIGVRSRMRQSASVSTSRLASISTSLVWSFQTVTACPFTLAKHGSVRIVSCQSSRIVMFMGRMLHCAPSSIKERAMADTGRLAVFHGTGKPFEIREYPVPEPEPGAMLIKVALANVCGSDLHYWRGELDYVKMGRPLPLNTGHEHVGRVAKLGPGVTTDSAGQPLAIGDRVAYRFFFPCGRCRACLMRKTKSCPVRQANWLVSCEACPHFQGGFGEYFYLRPNHAVFKLADAITDEMAAGVNCAFTQVYAGLDVAALRAGQTVVIQGAGGLGVYACAVAKEMGAARVIVIDGVEEDRKSV